MERIYLDHAATTPILPEVREAMAPWLSSEFGNPSSLHAEGRKAREAVDVARETISEALGCAFAEVVFTSSGTEAANLAILGAALANPDSSRKRVLLGAAEHHCVLHTLAVLERLGNRVELIPVDKIARVRLDALEEMVSEDVLLVAVMHANNEVGTIQPVREVSEIAHGVGALFFCDGVQTFPPPQFSRHAGITGPPPQRGEGIPSPGLLRSPKEPGQAPTFPARGEGGAWVEEIGADLVSVSAHKAHGPKGVGALYVRAGVKLKPISLGGGQERELRAGTENVAGIVGFGAAVRTLDSDSAGNERKREARDAFLDALIEAEPEGLQVTVPDRSQVLPGHAHVRFLGISAESMLILLDRMGVSASSGAACSSGSLEPSHVLLACGFLGEESKEGLRFTFGIHSTPEDAKEAARRVLEAASRIREAQKVRA